MAKIHKSITDADVLRAWLTDTQGHHNCCGCGACSYDPRDLDIPPFADNPGDSQSVCTVDIRFKEREHK